MMHRLDWDVVRTRLADAAVADRASDRGSCATGSP